MLDAAIAADAFDAAFFAAFRHAASVISMPCCHYFAAMLMLMILLISLMLRAFFHDCRYAFDYRHFLASLMPLSCHTLIRHGLMFRYFRYFDVAMPMP